MSDDAVQLRFCRAGILFHELDGQFSELVGIGIRFSDDGFIPCQTVIAQSTGVDVAVLGNLSVNFLLSVYGLDIPVIGFDEKLVRFGKFFLQ